MGQEVEFARFPDDFSTWPEPITANLRQVVKLQLASCSGTRPYIDHISFDIYRTNRNTDRSKSGAAYASDRGNEKNSKLRY